MEALYKATRLRCLILKNWISNKFIKRLSIFRLLKPVPMDSSLMLNTEPMDPRLKKLLKYGTSYADATKILPPVGTPSDWFNNAYFTQHSWWKEEGYSWWHEELNWEDLMSRDQAQMPDESNREGYFGQNHLAFWLSGYRDYRKTIADLESYGIHGGRCFDFGGSTGRVFRHFAFQSDQWDVWSSDFKISSVEWNQLYYPVSLKVLLNNSNPSLPLPDNYFDLVTAYSVFTHINETETSWLLELRRILKVGGIAYISIHNEATWSAPESRLWDTVETHRPDVSNLKEMPTGKTVVSFCDDDPYNCNVFHSRDYIEKEWGRFFEICEIKSRAHDSQAIIVCRRRD